MSNESVIQRIRELHTTNEDAVVRVGQTVVSLCVIDKQVYPCSTIKALDEEAE